MSDRLHDLEEITKKLWAGADQWRCSNGDIEFGIDTKYGMEWFPWVMAPSGVLDLVCAYKKMMPKTEGMA